MSDPAARRAAFRRLHESGCFAMPNPWDIGTARYLQHLGFKALATTSAGFAFSSGLPDGDGAVSRDAMLGHIAEIVAATDLPVNADFESGYARDAAGVGESVRLCVATGVAGLSIEDSTGDAAQPLFALDVAVERVKAARAAIDASGTGVLLTARAECCLVGHPDPINESIRRLRAYSEAGADVLYAPGPREAVHVQPIVAAVAPKPVNVLMGSQVGVKLSDLAAMGVRRVSVGSSLSRAAWTGFIKAAKGIAEAGDFSGFQAITPYDELNDLFREDAKKR